MQLYIKLLILLMFTGFAPYGWSMTADTIPFSQRILEIPEVVERDGDRAGVWGLPTLVALRYGLKVDEQQDERLNDEACRQAAITYLHDLYEEFQDWDLCYYAYLYSPTYVRNLQMRNLSIPQPQPVIKRPAPAKIVEKPQKPQHIIYTVKSGDTLSKIARKHHVKTSDLMKWNNLKSDLIRENQKLKIYQ